MTALRRVFVSGASGALGKAIVGAVREAGFDVVTLVRRKASSAAELEWDPYAQTLDPKPFEGAFGLIHLSGDNVGEGRWSEDKRRRIIESRVASTTLVARTIAGLEKKPSVFVCASAIGYYGANRGDEELTEESSNGGDFLSEVCRLWEDATANANVRTVNLRFGIVLSREGGALATLLPIFRMNLGARIGSGKQIMSWISVIDAARATAFALENAALTGPVNVVAPRCVTNQEFSEKLAKVLGKRTGVPVPTFVIKAAYGQMGTETALASQRVVPQKLLDAGFEFKHDGLVAALRDELNDG